MPVPEKLKQLSGEDLAGVLADLGIGPTGLLLLPAIMRIGAHYWKTSYPHQFREVEGYLGQCDSVSKEIRVTPYNPLDGSERPPTSVLVTLVHEVIHAIDMASGWNVFDEKHDALTALSEGLVAWMLDNPVSRIIDAVKILEGVADLDIEDSANVIEVVPAQQKKPKSKKKGK